MYKLIVQYDFDNKKGRIEIWIEQSNDDDENEKRKKNEMKWNWNW